MDATYSHQGILSVERMIERVHGIDRHKQFSTISVLSFQGEDVQLQGACREFGKYVEGLGPTDAVVMEASTGTFWWMDQIEGRGAKCFVNERHGAPWLRGSVEDERVPEPGATSEQAREDALRFSGGAGQGVRGLLERSGTYPRHLALATSWKENSLSFAFFRACSIVMLTRFP